MRNLSNFIVLIFILFTICSCANSTQLKENDYSSAITNKGDLPWGKPTDPLKEYDGYVIGRNNYEGYEMKIWMELTNTISKKILLTPNLVGSTFLVDLNELKPINQNEFTELGEFVTVLSITDDKETIEYIFSESGKIYTIQKGKRYYLGENIFTSHLHTMIFTTAAFDSLPDDTELPPLDFIQSTHNSVDPETLNQYVREYAPSAYQVYYVSTNYGEQSAPLLIKDIENSEYILQTLSSAWVPTPSTMTSGTGPILRLHNDKETLNFMITSEFLINYQIGNSMVFEIPKDFYRELQYIAAKEIAYAIRTE